MAAPRWRCEMSLTRRRRGKSILWLRSAAAPLQQVGGCALSRRGAELMNFPRMSNRPLRVLLVDDNDSLRENLVECLEAEGHAVFQARDGADALELLAQLAREGNPDVVVIDLLMPRMDGRELTEAVRRDPALRHLPIVLMTGANATDLDDLQVDAVLEKPFGLDQFLAQVERSSGPA